uniref:Uncharacterized protein n=1 Tax=Arion vulgaris TaxID=1028688 RepID=A0A0B7BIP5_9EUPU
MVTALISIGTLLIVTAKELLSLTVLNLELAVNTHAFHFPQSTEPCMSHECIPQHHHPVY